MALPKLSDADRKEALRKAVETRQKRADLKKKIKAGKITLNEVLNDSHNPIIAKMKVSALLQSLPGIGKARAQKLMSEIGIDVSRRIQGLGSKQRAALRQAMR